MSPIHKRLQTRMEHMRRFRHQHEQLRTVIVRVLRPNVGNTAVRIAENEQTAIIETADDTSFDAADSSAIEVSWHLPQIWKWLEIEIKLLVRTYSCIIPKLDCENVYFNLLVRGSVYPLNN